MKRKASYLMSLVVILCAFFALTSFEASAQMDESEIKSRLSTYSSWFSASEKKTFTITCPTYDLSDDKVFSHINTITSLLRGELVDDYCEITVKFPYSGDSYKTLDDFSVRAFTLEDKLKVYWTNWSETNQMDLVCSYTQSQSTGRVYLTSVMLSLNGSDPDDKISAYDAKISQIVENAKKAGSSKMDIVQYLCRWLDTNVDYSLFYQYTNSPYVAIMLGKGVCGSYANALKDMCELAGIPAIVPVNQYELNHAWNEIYIDGKWYTVDLCNVVEPVDGKYNGYCFLNPDREKFPVDHYSFVEKHKAEYVATFSPPNPKNLTAVPSQNSVKLSWQAAQGATGYRVYLYDSQTKKYTIAQKTTTATSYTQTNLNPGTKYLFAVKSYSIIGGKVIWADSFSSYLTATKPLPVTLSAGVSASSIKLSWNKVTAGGYRVFLYNKETGKWKAVITTKDTSYTFTSIKPGTTYKFAVRAYVNTGEVIYWSDYTPYISATTPLTPTVTLASNSKGKVTINWTNAGDVTGYQIYYSLNKTSGYKKLTNAKTSGTFSFVSGSTYYIRVRAYTKVSSGYVYGAFSPVKAVTVK